MKSFLIITLVFLTGSLAAAAPGAKTKEAPVKAAPSLTVAGKKPLAEEIYNRASENNNTSSKIRFSAGTGIQYLDRMRTSNSYFKSDHAGESRILPTFFLQSQFVVFGRGPLLLSSNIETGYSYRSSRMTLQSAVGTHAEDAVTMEWVPIISKIAATWSRNGQKIIPKGFLGAGTNRISQNGQLDGSSYSVWIPTLASGAGISIMGNRTTFFDSIEIDLEQSQSISQEHSLRTTALKLGFSTDL